MTDEQMGQPGSWNVDDDESLSWEQVRRYAEAPLRHPALLVVPWILVFLGSVVALYTLPKKYLSETLILVESEKVPDSFVKGVATHDSHRRLETIREEMLSRTRIERVLAETDPYPDISSLTRAVEKLRENTTIRVSGQDGFTVQFLHSEPETAQAVTEHLTSLFIEESISSRARQVEDAIEFLNTQVDEARRKLEEKDQAVRRYKEVRMGRLPEQLDSNLMTLGMLQRELQTVEENLIFTRTRKDTMIRGLEGSGDAAPGTPSQMEQELAEARRELAELRGRYTEEHPEMQSLRSRIERLQKRWDRASREPEAAPTPAPQIPDSVTKQQIEQAEAEIAKLEKRQVDLEGRIASLRARVEDTPRTVQELDALNRDYKKLDENYQALLKKQLDAQMAGRLEQRWKGERFRVLDPAYLPEKPFSPRALKLLVVGAVAGLLVGLGACLVAEFFDTSFKDPDELSVLGSFPVLASIPRLRPDKALTPLPATGPDDAGTDLSSLSS